MREAIETWLNIEDDPEVLDDEVRLKLHAVDEDLANLDVEDDVSGEAEDGGGRPESCITSSITEAEIHSRSEEVYSYLYAKERDGGFNETQYLLSKAVHSFTHETHVKCTGKERGEVTTFLERALAACNKAMSGIKKFNYYRIARKRKNCVSGTLALSAVQGIMQKYRPLKKQYNAIFVVAQKGCVDSVYRKKRILSAPNLTRHQALLGVPCHQAPCYTAFPDIRSSPQLPWPRAI